MNFKERYKYNPQIDLLGKGGFARVYKATDTLLDREVAIKVFNTTDNGYYTVLEEIKKVIKLEHPNLLRYYDVAILENTNAFGESEVMQVGIMELATAGDLKTFAKQNPNSNLLFDLLQQVLSGLAFLHSKGIIHRDLKPQNILLVKENEKLTAKISDFGISKSMDANTNSASLTIGTIEYMAPEQFKYGKDSKISTNLDLWSFGILVYELIKNKPPFGHRNGNTTAEQIMSSILSADLPEEIETIKEPYKTVIKKCLVADAKLRIQSANELIKYFGANSTNENLISNVLETKVIPKPIFTSKGTCNDLETKLVETPPIKLPKIDEPTNPKGKSKKSNILISILAILFSGFAIILGYKYFNKTNSIGENSNTEKFYTSIEQKLKNKQYDEILNSLKDSVLLNSSTISNKAVSIYSNMLLAKGDTLLSMPYMEKSVELGSSEHLFNLGNSYYLGKFQKPQDYTKAKLYFEKDSTNDKSITMLGNIYFMGQGLKSKDEKKAIELYKKAAGMGNSYAIYGLGLAYLNGAGVKKDFIEAKRWFDLCIQKNENTELVVISKKELGKIEKELFLQNLLGKWQSGVAFNSKGVNMGNMNSQFMILSANSDYKVVFKNGSVILRKWYLKDSILNSGKWFAKIIYLDNNTMKTSDIEGGTNTKGIDNWKKQ